MLFRKIFTFLHSATRNVDMAHGNLWPKTSRLESYAQFLLKLGSLRAGTEWRAPWKCEDSGGRIHKRIQNNTEQNWWLSHLDEESVGDKMEVCMITTWCSSSKTQRDTGSSLASKQVSSTSTRYGLINYTDTKAKCRHLKKLTCKETLRQVFICLRPHFLLWPHKPPPPLHTAVYVYAV